MSKGLVLGCALLVGAGIAAFHAAEPDCEGWYCLRSGEDPVTKQAAKATVEPATGRQAAKSGEGGERPAAADIIVWPEVDPAREPASGEAPSEPSALTVPLSNSSANAAAEAGWTDGDVSDVEGPLRPVQTPKQWRAAKVEDRKAADAWEALTLAALQEPDPIKRGQAISDVGNHRSEDAVGVLLEVATYDADTDNRYHALQSLWFSAADGLDSDGAIKSTLSAAMNDPDERIAELAKKAMEDLNNLEATQ